MLSTLSLMHYIIGLGNPDEQYGGTRHNVGRMVVMALNDACGGGAWQKSKHANALYTRSEVAGNPVEFILPETFMNRSGETVRYVVKKHGAEPDAFIVIHDDLDLPLGSFKISYGRGSGGHKGIDSIAEALGSKDFVRVRIGISPVSFFGKLKRPSGERAAAFVLQKFSNRETAKLDTILPFVVNAIRTIVAKGKGAAMSEFNQA